MNTFNPFAQLVCNSADDEFFLPDNIRYWWKEMPDYQRMNRWLCP